METENIFSFIPKIGDGTSWILQKIIQGISSLGVSITALQSKIILIILLGSIIYTLFSIITIAKKGLKWGLIILSVFLIISIIASIFTQ